MPKHLRFAVALTGAALLSACAKGDQSAQQPTDSAAHNLALAPTGGAMTGTDQPKPTAPATKPTATAAKPKPKPEPPKPVAPTTFTAASGTFLDAAVDDTVTTKTAKAG